MDAENGGEGKSKTSPKGEKEGAPGQAAAPHTVYAEGSPSAPAACGPRAAALPRGDPHGGASSPHAPGLFQGWRESSRLRPPPRGPLGDGHFPCGLTGGKNAGSGKGTGRVGPEVDRTRTPLRHSLKTSPVSRPAVPSLRLFPTCSSRGVVPSNKQAQSLALPKGLGWLGSTPRTGRPFALQSDPWPGARRGSRPRVSLIRCFFLFLSLSPTFLSLSMSSCEFF